MQAPAPAQKRPLDQSEAEAAAPKAKKSRAKAKSTSESTGACCSFTSALRPAEKSHVSSGPSSRRGYNAKKRSEAAQIAAQAQSGIMSTVFIKSRY